ncbi:MAG TPA: peptidylprolyl isomerase [Casimicrobiaceae bacterium]
MKTLLSAAALALVYALPASAPSQATASPVRVVMETDLGEIEIEVDAAHAPATAANFLAYVDKGLYDGGRFHRTVRPDNQVSRPVKIAVIQGAANASRAGEFLPPIPLERTSVTGLRHVDGAVSMARSAPDSATDEFFVCIGDQPALDFGGARNPDGQGFAVFGRVSRGLDVARRIQMAGAVGERLTPPIAIRSARRLGR